MNGKVLFMLCLLASQLTVYHGQTISEGYQYPKRFLSMITCIIISYLASKFWTEREGICKSSD